MYLLWTQNGRERVWNLSEKGVTRKLRNVLKKNVVRYGTEYAKLCQAKNVADMHYAIYGLIGNTPEFESFEIRSAN